MAPKKVAALTGLRGRSSGRIRYLATRRA